MPELVLGTWQYQGSVEPLRVGIELGAAMERLVEMGKVRFIGVSNFSPNELRRAQATIPNTRIVSNQVQTACLTPLPTPLLCWM